MNGSSTELYLNGPCDPLPADRPTFSTEEDAFTWAQSQAVEGGYALYCLYKNKSRSTNKIILTAYNCDKGLKNHNPAVKTTDKSKQRKGTGSKKTGCQFKITVKFSENTWKITEANAHNHGRNSSSKEHPAHRAAALPELLRSEIIVSAKAGLLVSQIMSAFKDRDGFNLVEKDISNLIEKEKQRLLGGLTPLQWLLDELQKKGFNPQYVTAADRSTLTRLMYLHPQAVELWKANPDVLLMDCTYKTNRFNMPLLNICGITGGNRVIQLGLVFLSSEKESDYSWALEQLIQIMAKESINMPLSIVTDRELALMKAIENYFPSIPHLLCRWHVNMNVLAKTKRYFLPPLRQGTNYVRSPKFVEFLKQWKAILATSSEEAYNNEVNELRKIAPKEVFSYVSNTWLIWKEKLVRFWVDKQLHFGYTVTSIVEGCHAVLKRYLRRSNHDFKGVYDRLLLFWASQQSSIADGEAQDQQKPRHNAKIPLLQTLIGHIHNFALQNILVKEIQKMPQRPEVELGSPCTCVLRPTYSLPCFHEIFECYKAKRSLQKSDIHVHWWFKRGKDTSNTANNNCDNRSILDILNPEVVSARGRPHGALGGISREPNSSTRRNLSEFELVARNEVRETKASAVIIPSLTIDINTQKRKRYDNNHEEDETYQPKRRVPCHNRVSRSMTALGIVRIDQIGDLYEPGTAHKRASMKIMSTMSGDGHTDESEAFMTLFNNIEEDDDYLEISDDE